MSKKEPRITVAVHLEKTDKGKTDTALIEVCEAFIVPQGNGDGTYPADAITYVKHHGLEVPGCVIFDGERYRTSRVTTYATVTDAALALVRGD